MLVLTVAGCGGGGGSDTEPSPQGSTLATPTITAVVDDLLPGVGTIANGGRTNDSTPTLTGSLDLDVADGQSVTILRDGIAIGQASVSGRQFSFTDRLSAERLYSYVAVVYEAGGRQGAAGAGFQFRFEHTRYLLSLLPLPPNAYATTPTAVNAAGDVAIVFAARGYSTCHLFSGRVMVDLASPERFCAVNAVSQSGQIAGTVDGGYPGTRRASIWRSPGDRIDIPVVANHDYSDAFDVSDSGVVAGTITTIGVGSNAFIWSPSTGSRLLGTLPGDSGSRALAINARHVVAGASVSANGAVRAIRWSADGGMQALGGFPEGADSEAVSINDRGDVAGIARSSVSGLFEAFLRRSSGLQRLPTISGTDQCAVTKIDAGGIVYGSCSESQPVRFPSYSRAAAWINSEAVDLNQRLDDSDPRKAFAIIDSASGADASGRIAVRVWFQGSTPVSHAALLIPIAE